MDFILNNYKEEGMDLEEPCLSIGAARKSAGSWMPLELDGVVHYIPEALHPQPASGSFYLPAKSAGAVLFDGLIN